MANRLMSNRIYSHDKDLKIVNARLTGAGNGTIAVLDAVYSKGVATIGNRQSAGLYDWQFGLTANGVLYPDLYNRLIGVSIFTSTATYAAATTVCQAYTVTGSNAIASTGILRIGLISGNGSAVDPASNDLVYINFIFADSTAP